MADEQRDTDQAAGIREQFDKDPWPVVGFLTTEHTALTSMRAATINESNARVTSYLTTLSAVLVALGFVASGSDGFGRGFFGFAAALLGASAVVGLVTYRRCVQISVDDLHQLARIDRVRSTYVALLPGLRGPLQVDDTGVDGEDLRRTAAMSAGNWTQLWLTMAGLVGLVNSVVIGAAIASLIRSLVDTAAVSWVVGGVVVLTGVVVHVVAQMRMMQD